MSPNPKFEVIWYKNRCYIVFALKSINHQIFYQIMSDELQTLDLDSLDMVWYLFVIQCCIHFIRIPGIFWFICSYWFFNYWSIIDFFPNQLWRPWNFGFRLITYGFPYVCNTNMYSRKLSFWDINHLFLHGWQPSWTPSWISQNAQGCPWVHPVDSERVGPGLPKSIKKKFA